MFIKKKFIIIFFILLIFAQPLLSKPLSTKLIFYPIINKGNQNKNWLSMGLTDQILAYFYLQKQIEIVSSSSLQFFLTSNEKKFKTNKELLKFILKKFKADILITGNYRFTKNKILINLFIFTEQNNGFYKIKNLIYNTRDLATIPKKLFSITAEFLTKKGFPFHENTFTKNRPAISIQEFQIYSFALSSLSVIMQKNSLAYFKKAFKLNNNFFDASLRIALIYKNLGNQKKSLKYLLKTKKILEKIKFQNTNIYCDVLLEIAANYEKNIKYKKALKHYLIAKKLKEIRNEKLNRQYTLILFLISDIYYKKLHNPCKAKIYLTECLKIGKYIGLKFSKDDILYLKKIKNNCFD